MIWEPKWLKEFKNQVESLRKISGDSWYKDLQDNLGRLKETGRGNCVAWSLLMKDIALKFKLTVYLIILSSPETTTERHQVSVIVDIEGTTYLQSCIYIGRQSVVIKGRTSKKRLLELLLECCRACEWHCESIEISRLEKFCNGKKNILVQD
jgi:hypothetical protein